MARLAALVSVHLVLVASLSGCGPAHPAGAKPKGTETDAAPVTATTEAEAAPEGAAAQNGDSRAPKDRRSTPKEDVLSAGPAQSITASPTELPVKAPAAESAAAEARNMDFANRAPADVSQIIDRYDDAVVYLTVQNALGEDIGLGSGFVIDPKGLVATNYHVIESGSQAFAQLRNGEKCEVAGYCAVDPQRDLIILQLRNPPEALEVFDLHHPAELHIGHLLVAMGHPEGFRFTATTGIVSAVRRTDELPVEYREALQSPDDSLWIQTNAAISHGSSGGPLLNAQGELVGINTWIAAGQNIGFATHVTQLLDLAKKIGPVQSLPVRGSKGAGLYTDREVIWLARQFQNDLQAYLDKAQQSGNLFAGFFKPKNPTGEFMKKLLELAEKRPGERCEFEALTCICELAVYDKEGTQETVRQALEKLQAGFLQDPNLGQTALHLRNVVTDDAQQFLREIGLKSQHADVQAYATLALGLNLMQVVDPESQLRSEMVRSLERASNRYGDVLLGRTTLRQMCESGLRRIKHFSFGGVPLPLEGKDHDGTPLSLAALRGQVVLVDFWVDWCPYCRDSYAIERGYLERFASRPFSILGVNNDPPERYASLVQDKTVTWPSIADGPDGPNNQRWQVESFPTNYLIDRYGVIRRSQENDKDKLVRMIEYLLDDPIYPLPFDLVAFGSKWRFWDTFAAPPADWSTPAFDDTTWKTGLAPLGFGQTDEACTLQSDPVHPDNTHATYYRQRFTVTDLAAVQDLVLALRCDDGCAVYLNGQEVARVNLVNAATHDAPATTESSYHDGREEMLFCLSPQLLQMGANWLAVEVHQAKQGRFDARFDLALATNGIASLTQTVAQTDSPNRIDALIALGRLGASAASSLGAIEALLADDDPVVRTRAAEALALITPERLTERPLPEPRDRQEAELRERYATQLNKHGWDACVPVGQPQAQYDQAARFLTVACYLVPTESKLINSRGLSELRMGKLDAALASFTASQEMAGDNAMDTLLLALTYQKKGEPEQVPQLLEKAKELSKRITSRSGKADFDELLSQSQSQ